jgi:hypothetical protein
MATLLRCACLAFFLISSGTALAQLQILGGGPLAWTTTNSITQNIFYVDDGSTYSEHGPINWITKGAGANMTLGTANCSSGSLCWSWGITGQVANTAYYVYDVIDGDAQWWIISTTAPVYFPGANVNINIDGDDDAFYAIFLGSYLTDGNGDIIPFKREGKEVFLFPEQSTSNTLPTWQQYGWWVPAGASAVSDTVTFSPFPASASAALTSIYAWNIGTSDLNFLIEDPWGMSPTGTEFWPQGYLAVKANTSNLNEEYLQLRAGLNSSNQLTIWAAAGVSTLYDAAVNVALVGYVEDRSDY